MILLSLFTYINLIITIKKIKVFFIHLVISNLKVFIAYFIQYDIIYQKLYKIL